MHVNQKKQQKSYKMAEIMKKNGVFGMFYSLSIVFSFLTKVLNKRNVTPENLKKNKKKILFKNDTAIEYSLVQQ